MPLDLLNLLGKQFEYGGRGPDTFDCYGLIIEIYRRRGIILKDYTSPDDRDIIDSLVEEGKEDFIKIEKPEPFCAVLFHIKGPFITHIGIVLPDCRRFIHCARKKQVVIEKLDHPFWKNRISGYYKYALSTD